jgi:O-methyltransferase
MSDIPTCPPELYLDILKRSLIRWGEDELVPVENSGSWAVSSLKKLLTQSLSARGLVLCKHFKFDAEKRTYGRDWPARAVTMIGVKRLNNIQYCVETVLHDNIPGDLVETGVWRGGASIFMRAVLKAYNDPSRLVWCADSFEGLPAPDPKKYPQDRDVTWHLSPMLAVSLEQVKENFERFGLSDSRVRFLKGWFKDTLPTAPIKSISVLRLDGDMYESTMDALNALYGKVSRGGFIIVDDYGIPEDTCRRAIQDFRHEHDIKDPIVDIDGHGAYWRKSLMDQAVSPDHHRLASAEES